MSDERAVDTRGELSGVQEHEGGKEGKGKGKEPAVHLVPSARPFPDI